MRRRQGFTLVEMLVSMALILFIMAIISQAFVAGLETFRQLKSTGDMDQNLRSAVSVLRHDLRAYHFDLKNDTPAPMLLSALPNTGPKGGFFVINQGAHTSEGVDADNNPCINGQQDSLYFTANVSSSYDPTIKLNRRENYFSATVNDAGTPKSLAGKSPVAFQSLTGLPNQNYYSQFAEVAYFLRPAGTSTSNNTKQSTQSNAATPLFTLYRRQLLIADNDAAAMNAAGVQTTMWPTNYYDISCTSGGANLHFNSMADVITPAKRSLASQVVPSGYPIYSEGQTTTLASVLKGSDILCTDVVSFTVEVLQNTGTLTAPIVSPYTGSYDSSTNPNPVKIQALQIILRVWDHKTQNTRQITILQDM